MTQSEQWIWLPENLYPECQKTVFSAHTDLSQGNYTVAEFLREYEFEQNVVSARLRFSGDTAFQLYLNDHFLATGPASAGGDFIGNDTPRENFYSFEMELQPNEKRLSFFARVRMMPVQICEYSKGRGGFMLRAVLTFADGTQACVHTDESWLARRNGAYCESGHFDGRVVPDEYVSAQVVENIWHTSTAPIPVRSEWEIHPEGCDIRLEAGESGRFTLDMDRIYAGFISLRAECEGEVHVRVNCRELEEKGSTEEAVFASTGAYRGFAMHSAGNLVVEADNRSAAPARLRVGFIDTHYPAPEQAEISLSDQELTRVLDTCAHTLKICRQTIHLDSPRHCEPLACTGDYYIESLMTLFSFGDMRLAEFDVRRTALLLEREGGRMFHTTYSCIWVKMLYDTYMATGNMALLADCTKALGLLLDRFSGYIGENGLIETPPDYMFVDWIYIDGLSMHHPPKALGQTCLNLFYFGALEAAEKIYGALGRSANADACAWRREALGRAINELLFDGEKGVYFEGLNTPTDERLVGGWMPRNVEKRYYLKHSNILAAYMGVCDDERARSLINKVMSDQIEGDIQPYFTHFLLEAVYRLGLREKYTLEIVNRWKPSVAECPKGLAEGFVKPEPSYRFDHSHAWGGTPLYSLPKALMGLEIVKPGMEEIWLSPSLLGLESAHVELMTPRGRVVCDLREGEQAKITRPEGVTVRMDVE